MNRPNSGDWREGTSVNAHSSSTGDYEWGLISFIKEARTLARFRHPSIVDVKRIIEANGTASMVLDYEAGDDFGKWLEKLGRPPIQEEPDGITAALLDPFDQAQRHEGAAVLQLHHQGGLLGPFMTAAGSFQPKK